MVELDPPGGVLGEERPEAVAARRGRSRAPRAGRRRSPRTGRRPRASAARPRPGRPRAAARRRAAARSARSSGRACRACRRRAADARPGLPSSSAAAKSKLEQVVVALELERVEPLAARGRDAGVEHPPRVRAPLRLLDEEEPRAGDAVELAAQMRLQLLGDAGSRARMSRSQRPRYSTSSQWSIRLAVAVSGSPASRASSAQYGRGRHGLHGRDDCRDAGRPSRHRPARPRARRRPRRGARGSRSPSSSPRSRR